MNRVFHGDALTMLKYCIEDNSVDAIVTDPPYGLSFMGKKWDYDVPSEEIWRECLRVLKPGGHLLAFAGTRTQHRMAVRIEDAGFEIRDLIMWCYGSGFPKSLDVSKAIDKAAGAEREVIGSKLGLPGYSLKQNDTDEHGRKAYGKFTDADAECTVTAPATDAARQWQGWGTALKPALEPITVARKPLMGTVAENVLAHGTGAINVDGCRVETTDDLNGGRYSDNKQGDDGNSYGSGINERSALSYVQPTGRWPANLIHDGSDEVLAGFPDTGPSPKQYTKKKAGWLTPGSVHAENELQSREYGDAGSAARFFKECNQWQDHDLPRSSADTAPQSLSLQNVLASIVQNAVAIWPSLAGIASSEQRGRSTSVTQSESKAINETAMQAMASIASGFSQESRHERRTPSGSLVKTAATQEPTGTTTITTSLCRSDGSAEAATLIITPSNLERGDQVSRFNYCAKASKRDRGAGNNHPTVKPTDLMRYLCRLVTPPGGMVLDPFMGSGSTGVAAQLEGFRFTGIEREAAYVAIAASRGVL